MKDRCKVLGHRRGGISTEEQMHEKGPKSMVVRGESFVEALLAMAYVDFSN
jgi:hypothetical protein